MLRPITLTAARQLVAQLHRHLPHVQGGLFAVACQDAEQIRGVAIVGRPSAREDQDGWTCEVVRCATDGARNACSLLYGACWRAARAHGYRRLVTFTLGVDAGETGASLRAAGFRHVRTTRGGAWTRADRPRADHHTTPKHRWEQTSQPARVALAPLPSLHPARQLVLDLAA